MKSHRPYELREYDPKWKEIFSTTTEEIRPIFGDNLISIEHIGSTSIEGMVAKPQVDILVVVKNLDSIRDNYDTFLRVGFTPRGREYVGNGDEYITKDAPDGRRLVSIHIFENGHAHIQRYRIFRDYLKSNTEDRELYIATKRKLYAEHKENYEAYDNGKQDTIEAIRGRANEWATNRS